MPALWAAAWAAREVFPEVREYAMWEREPAMIAFAERLMRGEAAFAGAAWMQGDLLHGLAGRRAELVTAAYALGELTPEAREAAVLASRGDLLPARRAQVERLMGLLMELSREEQA